MGRSNRKYRKLILDPPTPPASSCSGFGFEVHHEPGFAALEAERGLLSAAKEDDNPPASPGKAAQTPAAGVCTPNATPSPDYQRSATSHQPESTTFATDLGATPVTPSGVHPDSPGTRDTPTYATLVVAGSSEPSISSMAWAASPEGLAPARSSFDKTANPCTSPAAQPTENRKRPPRSCPAAQLLSPVANVPAEAHDQQSPQSPNVPTAQSRVQFGTSGEITPRHEVTPPQPPHAPTERDSILSPWVVSWYHHRYPRDDAKLQDACNWYEQAILAMRSLGEGEVLAFGQGGIVVSNRDPEITRLPMGETENARRTQPEDGGPGLDGLTLREGDDDMIFERGSEGAVRHGDLEPVGKGFQGA